MSRIEKILRAMIDRTSYNEAPQSRIEEILLAIKNDTDYLKSPCSRVETLLLAIKNNTDYSDLLQSRIEEILEYKLHNTVYEKDALSRIEKLLIDWIGKADYYEKITGVPPLSFVSNGENLSDCKIYGASGGVGDRTANLYNESAAVDTDYYIKNDGSSAIGSSGDRFLQVRLDVTPSTYYTFEWSENVFGIEDNTAYIRISEYKQNGIFIKRTLCNCSAQIDNVFTFTTDNNTAYIDLRIDTETSSRGQHLTGVMLTLGNIPPETYEPYGYKIPIVVAGKNLFDESMVTEDAFLYVGDGTVRKNSSGTANVSGYILTKKSRKYILTFSAESLPNGFSTVVCYYDTSKQYTQQRNSFVISPSSERYFFELVPQNDGYIRVKYPSSAFNLQVEDSDSATDYEPHYESQTAAIYLTEPLAEGESISSRSAGVSIPTINGSNTLSIGTTVQPSHIYIKYKGG